MSKGDLNLWTDFVIGREAHGVCRLAEDRNSRERTPYRYRYPQRAKTASRVQHSLVSAACCTRGAQLGCDALSRLGSALRTRHAWSACADRACGRPFGFLCCWLSCSWSRFAQDAKFVEHLLAFQHEGFERRFAPRFRVWHGLGGGLPRGDSSFSCGSSTQQSCCNVEATRFCKWTWRQARTAAGANAEHGVRRTSVRTSAVHAGGSRFDQGDRQQRKTCTL